MENELPSRDLQSILEQTRSLWEDLRGEQIFITGGTGFFGRWLVESFLHANRTLALGARATVLSRSPEAFAQRAPHIAHAEELTLLKGDVCTFSFPAGTFRFVIHAAAERAPAATTSHPLEGLRVIERGTERTLEFASTHGTKNYLLVSSGAAYGRQPAEISHMQESYPGAPSTLDANSIYGEGKRVSELMCSLFAAKGDTAFKIARCFAFVGPGLPLDSNFAIGNFIADALAGRPVSVASDGTSRRSYLYASDLAVWLWTILFRAPSLEIFNVGSEEAISVGGLAERVATTLGSAVPVKIAQAKVTGGAGLHYVPSTQKAASLLQLRQTVSLEESILRTANWYVDSKSLKETEGVGVPSPAPVHTQKPAQRTLITGATGFVGSWLTHRLVSAGDEVAVLIRSTSDRWRLQPLSHELKVIEADLSGVGTVAEQIHAFAPQRVFHLAWSGGNSARFNDAREQVYSNVAGSLDLMRVAADAGAEFFLNLGSCIEYGTYAIPVRETDPAQPANLYGAAKHAVEDLLLRLGAICGVRTASVRLFWSYGPGDDEARLVPSLTRSLLHGERHSMTPATQIWDFLYITDVVDALVAIADQPQAHGVFNLGSGQPQPLREVAETLQRITRSSAPIGFGDIPFPPNQPMHLEADVQRLKEATGWSPRVPLEEGLARTVAWYRSGSRVLPV